MRRRSARSSVIIADRSNAEPHTWPRHSRIVRTPLDLVTAVTQPAVTVDTVVLVGEFAQDRAFAHFLKTSYPGIEVVVAAAKDRPPVV
jgi:hypothetical protein